MTADARTMKKKIILPAGLINSLSFTSFARPRHSTIDLLERPNVDDFEPSAPAILFSF